MDSIAIGNLRSRSVEERSCSVDMRTCNGIKKLPKLDTMGTATVEVQALNKPTNTNSRKRSTVSGVRRMAMAVFLGGRNTPIGNLRSPSVEAHSCNGFKESSQLETCIVAE
jgi:hypothetical protein